jgi:DNA polymerase-4
MARLQARVERDLGLTVSVGLSHNKFLAKIASDLDKPRGFSVIGRAETQDFLAPRPVSLIWGVGQATLSALEAEGLRTIADLRARDRKALIARFGALGDRLWGLAQGEDPRPVSPDRAAKSISNETTLDQDLDAADALRPILWGLAETVSARLKAKLLSARTLTLKLKRADHRILTRRQALETPTRMADRLFRAASPMLQREIPQGPFRLVGLGASDLAHSALAESADDLLDGSQSRRLLAEQTSDRIRERFGQSAIILGRTLG